MRYRAGVDIGGTFTDIVLMSEEGQLHVRKQPSTPDDYSRGIAEGLQALCLDVGADAGAITELVHATTVATNAILEGKGAVTGLITTQGFRDVLELGRIRYPRLYDLQYVKPRPLALRRHRFEVAERVAADGAITLPLDDAEIDRVIAQVGASEVTAVAICLLNSYANAHHEQILRDRLVAALPDLYVTCSCDVLPEIREYERTSTTVVNAYLGPIVRNYLSALTARLRNIGLTCPIRIMQSNGGLMNADEAIAKPAYIIESGPAAGVIAGAHLASLSGYADVITVDMGGTTAKAAIIENGEPARTTEYEVGAGINLSSKLIKGGGYSVKLPFIDVSEVGAGGGSLVNFDAGGLLRVGPESAGSVPGPVCYGRGNTIPTLTDVFVTLGYLNQEAIAGGEVPIHAAASRDAVEAVVATPLGLTSAQASLGVQAVATATMARAVKAVSTYRGRDPRDFVLFAFGGNGPMIAAEIAKSMGMRKVVIPAKPGVFSALGLLFSQLEHEFRKSNFRVLNADTADNFADEFCKLEAKSRHQLLQQGYAEDDLTFQRLADIRYEGQAFELTLPALSDAEGRSSQAATITAFHAEHARTYGHSAPGQPVELIGHRVRVLIGKDQDAVKLQQAIVSQPREVASREAFFEGVGKVPVPVYSRDHLVTPKTGPLIIEEYDSTCVVPPGAVAQVDANYNIIIVLEPSDDARL